MLYSHNVGFLLLVGLLAVRLEVLLVAQVDVETVGKWRPLRFVYQLGSTSAALLFIGHDSVVDIQIVGPESALLGDHLDMNIITHKIAICFQSLRSLLWRCKVILTLQALMPFDRVLQLELDFRVVWRELQADLVYELGGQGEVRPPLQVLIALVLQAILAALVEFDHFASDNSWHGLILAVFQHGLMNIVRHNCEWLGCGWRRDLLHKVVAEGVLNARVLQEDCVGTDVEHSVVTLHCAQKVAVMVKIHKN